MPITTDIVATYRSPRRVMRSILDRGAGEPQALGFVMIACFIMWVSRLPSLQRAAFFDPDGAEFTTMAAVGALGGIIFAPILFYGVAGLSRLIAKALGGQGTWLRARLALFWSLLAVSPLVMLHGLVAGFIGTGPALNSTSLIGFVAFMAIWVLCLKETEVGA